MMVPLSWRLAFPRDPRRRPRSAWVIGACGVLVSVALSVGVGVVAPTVAAAAPTCPCSLWSDSATPATVDSGDPHAVEVGVQISSATSGYLSGLRFYKALANTGIHIGSLWTADGTLLTQATFSNETASGWQQVSFSQPVAISANTLYVAGYHTDTGHYSADEHYFTNTQYTNAPLTAPGGNPANPNGLYAYSPTPTFPTGTFNASNYWVDVVYASAATPVSIHAAAPQTTLPKGTSGQLSASESFSDGTSKDVTTQVTWSTSNPGVASVSASGMLTTTGVGPTSISASLAGLTTSLVINVVAPIGFLMINPPFMLLGSGRNRQLTAVAWLADGNRLDVTALTKWRTIYSGGGTVSATGLVTANHPGLTTLTATVGRWMTYGVVVVVP